MNMKTRLLLAAGLLFLACTVDAGEPARPTIDVSELTVRVHWSTPNELRSARAEFHITPRRKGISSLQETSGFSVLRRNTETGAYVCDLYVEKPQQVDDEHTLALGHELLHCLAGAYHR